MTSVRVLLAGLPQLLAAVVKGIVGSQEGIEVVGEAASQDGLSQMAVRTRADVIVLGEEGANGHGDYRELLYARPRLRILALMADGRRGSLHELRLEVTSLGEVSPGSLIGAIRGPASSGSAETK